MNRLRPPEVAFVFPSGGSSGAAQVGILAALLEAGITPDMLVGSSVGALNAAYMSAAPHERAAAVGAEHVGAAQPMPDGLKRRHPLQRACSPQSVWQCG